MRKFVGLALIIGGSLGITANAAVALLREAAIHIPALAISFLGLYLGRKLYPEPLIMAPYSSPRLSKLKLGLGQAAVQSGQGEAASAPARPGD